MFSTRQLEQMINTSNCNSWMLPDAINIMVSLRQCITGDKTINSESTRGRSPDPTLNPTIAKIATDTFNGGRFRFVEWHAKKLLDNEAAKIIAEEKLARNNELNDMMKAKQQFDQCFELMKSRNAKYGDSRKRLGNSSIVDLMIMKLDRCQKQELDDKALEVEIEDVVNYGIFALINLRNK